MVFQPGNNANPLGRPKRRNVISEDYQAFCRDHQNEIKKVGQLVLEKAVVEKEPWAMKLCMEYFYPKPERSVAITKDETASMTMTMDDRLKTCPRSKMKCNTTIVLDVKTSETSGVAYEKISSIAI